MRCIIFHMEIYWLLQLLSQMDVGLLCDSPVVSSHNSPSLTMGPHTMAIVDHWSCRQSALRVKRVLCESIPHSILFTWGSLRLIKPQSLLCCLATGRENHWVPWAHHHKIDLWTHARYTDHMISLETGQHSIMLEFSIQIASSYKSTTIKGCSVFLILYLWLFKKSAFKVWNQVGRMKLN